MGIDAIVSLLSLFGPKIIDLVKGVVNRKNTPEQTLATLATTNPEALAQYTTAQSQLVAAINSSVNSDVAGQLSQWVSNVRAMIRPVITVAAFGHIIIAHISGQQIPDSVMYIYETAIGSWFGGRLR